MTPEERSIYEVAFHLRMPVYKLMLEMPYAELQNWITFFQENPPTRHSDYQTAMLMKMLGFKGSPASVFDSLKSTASGGTIASTLKTSTMYQYMLQAVGGDQVEL